MTVVAGVDACKGGWVAIVLDDDRFAGSLLAATFGQLLGALADAAAVGAPIMAPPVATSPICQRGCDAC